MRALPIEDCRLRIARRRVSNVGAFFEHGTVHRPLEILGMHRAIIYSRTVGGAAAVTFWERHGQYLENLLHEAHLLYRRAMKSAHSDKRTGSHERAVLINAAWQRVKYLFGKRGVTLN